MPWHDRIKRNFKLRDLDILMAVVQTGAMARAATQLHMSQPAVSKAIADLERTLGVKLLHRGGRGVDPTPYGTVLVQHGFAMFDELRRSVEHIDFISDPTAGDIRIGTTEPVATAIVSPVVSQMSKQYPKICFHVAASDTRTLYRELSETKIELVISRTPDAAAKDLSVEVLFDDPLVVVTGKNNPLARRRKIEFVDLMDAPWAIQPADNFFGSLVADAFRSVGLTPPRLAVSTTSFNLRSDLINSGRFLSVVPGYSVRLPRPNPLLRVLPVEFPDVRHQVAIFTLKGRSLSPLASLFIEHVRNLVKPLVKGG
jgi:DNA-binding transcriptional LysR family regulator